MADIILSSVIGIAIFCLLTVIVVLIQFNCPKLEQFSATAMSSIIMSIMCMAINIGLLIIK